VFFGQQMPPLFGQLIQLGLSVSGLLLLVSLAAVRSVELYSDSGLKGSVSLCQGFSGAEDSLTPAAEALKTLVSLSLAGEVPLAARRLKLKAPPLTAAAEEVGPQ
jgi:hypothetical protein